MLPVKKLIFKKLLPKEKNSKLILEDGTEYAGISFGAERSISGEVVFNTGMVGYPESLTDPSYYGQILTLTYPLVGNYGVPKKQKKEKLNVNFESSSIKVRGLVVADYSHNFSHYAAAWSLGQWLQAEGVPGIYGIDTRALTKKLRKSGVMLGKIVVAGKNVKINNPSKLNLSKEVSAKKPIFYRAGRKKVVLLDLGAKDNIVRSLISRGISVARVPYNYDFISEEHDGLLISNGPGDPKQAKETIALVKKYFKTGKPIFGICFGNQLLALAAGGETYKLKYGHRSQNQPCVMQGTKRCYITSQNHGYAVNQKKLPRDWQEWFYNLNDKTNEGIKHKKKPWMSVQFHPEAKPGPSDTDFLFDDFVKLL